MKLLFSILLILLVGCSQELPIVEKHIIIKRPIVKEDTRNPWFKEFDDNYQINHDYLGNIYFESGLFDLEVFKSDDYDEYLRTNWRDGTYDIGGSIFIDPYASLDSQNICFYGHNYDSGDKMFTPLHMLKDEANYASNRIIKFDMRNESRVYEIAYVFYVEIKTNGGYSYIDDLYYMHESYNNDELEAYRLAIENVEFYDTGIKLNPDDNWITLQTCVSGEDNLRLIVVAKEIERNNIR